MSVAHSVDMQVRLSSLREKTRHSTSGGLQQQGTEGSAVKQIPRRPSNKLRNLVCVGIQGRNKHAEDTQ